MNGTSKIPFLLVALIVGWPVLAGVAHAGFEIGNG